MPGKKTRKVGGMPWWYIRKNIIFPAILLAALIVISVVIFSLFKSKRLSYIPRAEGETGCQIAEGVFVSVGENVPNSNLLCCRENKIFQYSHLEEDKCSSEQAEPANSETQTMREDIIPPPSQEVQKEEADGKTNVQNVNLNETSGTVRIMLLGDSLIGGSFVASRLKTRLRSEFPAATFEFVGSQSIGGVPHEGHGSFKSSDIARDLEDGTWDENQSSVRLSESRPDVVIVQLGTNNVSSGWGYSKDSYSRIFSTLRNVNQFVKIVVSQVPTMYDTGAKSPKHLEGIQQYNQYLIRDMPSLSTSDSPVILTGLSNFTLNDVSSFDGVHPVSGGEDILISNYVGALRSIFVNGQRL